jgi:hypothetical protein
LRRGVRSFFLLRRLSKLAAMDHADGRPSNIDVADLLVQEGLGERLCA